MRFRDSVIPVLLALSVFPLQRAVSQNIALTTVPAAIADGGGTGVTGTPYAVAVNIQGWAAAANSQVYLKIYSSTNNEFMWTGSVWSNATAYAAANQPVVALDASGSWSGWIYAKHNVSLGATASVRAARVGATSTNLTSPSKPFTILQMQGSGNGGWIMRPASPAVNKGILAYAGGTVVGTYRTEDNGIAEGYAYAAGGFAIAVPAGIIDSLVAVNDDGSRDRVFAGPWSVTAGQQTDASGAPGGVGRGHVWVAPATLAGGTAHTVTITIAGESPFVLAAARVRIPAAWSWSHALQDLTLDAAGSPVLAVAGETILVSALALAGSDSMRLTIANITPPDSTAAFPMLTATGTDPDSVFPVGTQPSVFVYGIPVPIAVVKENDANGIPLRNGSLVTVRGVVTVANEFGGPSYIQDNSGGMAVFGSAFSSAVTVGDEVVVSGLMQPFSGLTEIVNPMLQDRIGSGNVVPPVRVTAAQLRHDGAGGVELYEGCLVRVDNATVGGSGAWAANTNYTLADATDSTQLRIDNNTDLVGGAIPVSACDIVGVVGQFISASPYIGGYQLMPRSLGDVFAAGPVIATVPREGNLTPSSFSVSWNTVRPGTSALRYGLSTAYELGALAPDTNAGTAHAMTVSGLQPATIYHVQVSSVSGADTSRAGDLVVSTSSPPQATGVINVYFNKTVLPSVVPPPPAAGSQDLVALLSRRFNDARRSIDLALYSLSGTPGPGTDLATALIAARNRGVHIRVICEQDNRATAPLNTLAGAGIPLITDAFDAANAGAGLMHNKFAVIDGRGGAPDSVWVWTGSWNPTSSGTSDDYQNAIEIQDPALAGAYTTEFNEMWGSDTDVPDAARARFGARKTDNTPHRFRIANRDVECYFSPSDHTTSHIIAALAGAAHAVHFTLLTLTRDDIAAALVERKNAGVVLHGLMDNRDDSGSDYDYLLGQGVDMHLKTGSGLLHHKYAIIDAGWSGAHPTVITGSHNWTTAAETANNENTLIIQDASLANFYLQEFAARYYQFGGTETIATGVEQVDASGPAGFALVQNYPNPFNPSTTIGFSVPQAGSRVSGPGAAEVRLAVYDLLGREVAVLAQGRLAPGSYRVTFDAAGLASGVYIARLRSGTVSLTRPMLLVR